MAAREVAGAQDPPSSGSPNDSAGGPSPTIKDVSIQTVGWVQLARRGLAGGCLIPASFCCSGWIGDEAEKMQVWPSEGRVTWGSDG